MKCGAKLAVGLVAGAVLALKAGAASSVTPGLFRSHAATSATASTGSTASTGNDNGPYHAIVDRNVFDLRDKPEVKDEGPPPPPPPNVKLIGIMMISGRVQGVFSVQDPVPGKQPVSYILADGERHGSLDVKVLDLAAKTARVQIDSDVVTLKLEKPTAVASAAPGGVPGAGIPLGQRGMVPGARGGPAGMRGGFGGAPAGTYQPYVPPGAGGPSANYAPGVSPDGLPTRQVRTDETPVPPAEQQVVQIEQNREQMLNDGNPLAQILPPTPLTASLQAQRDAANQQPSQTTTPTPTTPQLPGYTRPVVRGSFNMPPMPGQ